MRAAIAAILKDEGYISDFSEGTDEKGFKTLTVDLKFVENTPAITGIERQSKPGRRLYYGVREIPRVLVVSVSQSSQLPKALCAPAMPARLALAASSSARLVRKAETIAELVNFLFLS